MATLATMALASAIDGAIQRKMQGREVLRARKEIILIGSNKDVDDIIRNIKSLQNWVVLLDAVIETVNHDIKKQKCGFHDILLRNLGASMLGDVLTRKGAMREEKEYNNMYYIDNFF